MVEREAICVKSLTLKLNRAKRFGPVYVPSLPNQRVAAKPGLNADLVALSRFKTHFDQGGGPKPLDHLIMTHSIGPSCVARMRLFLNERLLVPHEPVAPRSGRRIGMTVHHGPIHTFDRVPFELPFQAILSRRLLGEHHESGRVAIDTVHDERPPLPV